MHKASGIGAGHLAGHSCSGGFVILVTGIPASGKSALAERLSADLGLPWFSKDRIKEELFDTVGFASKEMDSFSAGGPVITVDTTDFSKVDWKELYQEIESFCKGGGGDEEITGFGGVRLCGQQDHGCA